MAGETNCLYVVLSATPYRMGHMIRRVTGEPYNHISIATDESLTRLYSFARRYYRLPLYGGFVAESPARYHHKGITSQIRVYRLRVPERRWKKLVAALEEMEQHRDHFLYNHLSVLAAPIHRKISIQDAYTCAEFVVAVLNNLGFGFDPERFYTIGEIGQALEEHLFYQGDFPAPAQEDPEFFRHKPVNHPNLTCTRVMMQLCWRLAVANFLDSRVRRDIVR